MRLKSDAARQVQAPRLNIQRLVRSIVHLWESIGKLQCVSPGECPSVSIVRYDHASFTDVSYPAHCIVCQAPRPNNLWTAARWNGA